MIVVKRYGSGNLYSNALARNVDSFELLKEAVNGKEVMILDKDMDITCEVLLKALSRVCTGNFDKLKKEKTMDFLRRLK